MNVLDCELCGVSFEEREHFSNHMTQHTDDITVADKVFDCENCRRSFFTMQDFDRHNSMVHTPYRPDR